MAADKLPSMQFYPGDWMKDPALRSVGLAARGLWIDMLCLMFESHRRGYLLHVTGKPVTPEQLARMVGGSAGEVSQLLQELEDCGVFSRTEHGAIYSRRLERDEQRRRTCAANGRRGGNPALVRNDADLDKPSVNRQVKRGVNQNGNQTPTPSSSSSSSSSSSITNPPPPPPGKRSAPPVPAAVTEPEEEGEEGQNFVPNAGDRLAEARLAVKAAGLHLSTRAVEIATANGLTVDGILAIVGVFNSSPGKWSDGALYDRLTSPDKADSAPNEGWVPAQPGWSAKQPRKTPAPPPGIDFERVGALEQLHGARLDAMEDNEVIALALDSKRFTMRDRADVKRLGREQKELRAKLLMAIGDLESGK